VQFTRITGELEPEDIARLLNHYLSEMTKIARKHNGTVDKFIGDAVLIHFGDHGSRGEKQDAIDCVQMAIDMQLRMRELSAEWIEQGFEEPFQIRCGINTGYAAVGNFGSEDRLDYTIIGSNVNLASRIQSNAEPGHILISHATWALARDHFRLEPRDNIAPKGFNRTIPVYAVKF
jgi:class 3 adenylate cyclase